jgi:SAM-dependent methyltransferase
MRNRDPGADQDGSPASVSPGDERSFFTSYSRSTVSGSVLDSMTIGTVSEPEARFHYNASENSIIRALSARDQVNQPPAVWRFAQQRRDWSVLDIGSGTGHWVDFYLDVYLARSVTAVEFVPQMAGFLREKYRDRAAVRVFEADVAESLPATESFDIVNAIGVMFHIVDDVRWRRAIGNLAGALKADGVMLVGGDFGDATRDVQFHRVDEFASWREHDAASSPPRRVNKRVRSLEEWTRTAHDAGLAVVDLIRSDACNMIRTPENDLLVLRRA